MKVLQPWHLLENCAIFGHHDPTVPPIKRPTIVGDPGFFGDVSSVSWAAATDWDAPLTWLDEPPQPLFQRLELDEILAAEQGPCRRGR